jgi:hypothetical protein
MQSKPVALMIVMSAVAVTSPGAGGPEEVSFNQRNSCCCCSS